MHRHEAQKQELQQILQMMEERFNEEKAADKFLSFIPLFCIFPLDSSIRKAFDVDKQALEDKQRNEIMQNRTTLNSKITQLTTAVSEVCVLLSYPQLSHFPFPYFNYPLFVFSAP